ncbi:MAG: ComF family protein [Defluviitaleaceae bacterium]|nr:ComF family protein [Defluviitaleaceae bacterium]
MKEFLLTKSNGRRLLEIAYATLYPNKCLFCRRVLDNKQSFSCTNCQIAPANDDHHAKSIDQLHIPYAYEDEVRNVVYRFKYGGAKSLAKPMAVAIYSCFPDIIGDFLVPVPLYVGRQKQRGFNQAAELAMELSKLTKIPAVDGLQRLRDTVKQLNLSREQRMENLSGAIALKSGFCVEGKRIVLVDDIFTTGATAGECANALKTASATHVDLTAFAKVQSV